MTDFSYKTYKFVKPINLMFVVNLYATSYENMVGFNTFCTNLYVS